MKKRLIYGIAILVIGAGAYLFYSKEKPFEMTVTDEAIATKVDVTVQEKEDLPFTITSYNLGDTVCGIPQKDVRLFYVNDMYIMANAGYFGENDMGNTKSSFDEDIYYTINLQTKMCEMKVHAKDSFPEIGVPNGFVRLEEKAMRGKGEARLILFDINTKKETVLASDKGYISDPVQWKKNHIMWIEDEDRTSRLIEYDSETGKKEVLYKTEGERTYTSHTGTTIEGLLRTEVGMLLHKRVTKDSGAEEALISLVKENGDVVDYPNPTKAYSVALDEEWIVYATEQESEMGRRKIEVYNLADKQKRYEFLSGANGADIHIRGNYLFVWEDLKVDAVYLPTGKKTTISSGEASKVQVNDNNLVFTEEIDGEERFNVIQFK
ncbi:hypothetical protein [Priestia taiwanensis]|uniref:Uncharacterized protein n=1 Tax=Priestia taiwanensis TaxID=1347902 RepID=A0A917AY42_9BACI|nr:hypothetical protein [Priestia taiwanensis]MBM7365028.1 hypothetical protein [Priestia taiwanensis]GGE83496.1 hypothetical protein GCM10007140_36270 [Priestia taiwanensis]